MNILNGLQGVTRRICQCAAIGITSFTLIACGGSSTSDSTDDGVAQSKLSVSLTDAEGDFLTYQVDVSEIILTRANGAVVNVLSRSTTVDFAQYVEVTELLTILDAPSGAYTSASMSLDFSDAVVTVQNEAGEAIVADLVDTAGNPLDEVSVDIAFNDREGFVLVPGLPAQLTLDFDLDASNEIEIIGEAATVTVQPILIADTILEEPKPFRLRGLLASVSEDDSEFNIDLRPFRVRSGVFGDANVKIDDDTNFEIDGVVYNAEEGLQALSEKSPGTAVVSLGSWDREAREYLATNVLAGSSIAWDQADILRGTVVAREGNVLSIRGAIVELAEGSFVFNETFTVEISENSTVTKRGDDEVTIADISVGSAVYVAGEVSDTTLDASGGLVRITPSRLSGFVVSTSPLSVDMKLMNGRRASIYDFSGTGTSEATDAEIANYEVNTGSLALGNVLEGDPIRAKGYTSAFGAAPEDFYATTIIDASSLRAHMTVGYGFLGSDMAIDSVDESGIVTSIEDSLFRHHIARAGVLLDMNDLDETPSIVPGGERGVYTIWVNATLEVYTYYSAFAEALAEDLEGNVNVKRIDAHGYFDRNANTFSTQRLGVILLETDVL